MWPRKLGSSTPLMVSKSAERGLANWPGDAADLHDGHAGAVRQHDGHLEDDFELVADVVGGEVVEGLGAVAGLQDERSPGRDLGERAL